MVHRGGQQGRRRSGGRQHPGRRVRARRREESTCRGYHCCLCASSQALRRRGGATAFHPPTLPQICPGSGNDRGRERGAVGSSVSPPSAYQPTRWFVARALVLVVRCPVGARPSRAAPSFPLAWPSQHCRRTDRPSLPLPLAPVAHSNWGQAYELQTHTLCNS
jgi:hypothetical protein